MPREARPRRPLRILMVLESDYVPAGGGGAESQVRTLAHQLRSLGHRVTVITPQSPDGRSPTVERIADVAVARLRYPRVRKLGGLIMNARFVVFLLQNRRRYDAWHVHIGHNLGALACLVGDLLGVPVVLKISGWWELEKGLLAADVGPARRLVASWLRRATSVQAISTRLARELERRGFPAERIVVLPNAVDVSRFGWHTARRTPGEPFVAVYVGRLSEEKGVVTLLEAWSEAFRGRGDVRLRIVGGGALAKELEAQAERLGIAHQVELLGPRGDVENVLRDAHVGLLPSRIEGLSNALLELMASGLPTVATRVSGSEDFVVTGRNGWLVPASDVGTLAERLREAAALSAEELDVLGRHARADVMERASVDRVVDRLVTLYQEGSV